MNGERKREREIQRNIFINREGESQREKRERYNTIEKNEKENGGKQERQRDRQKERLRN